MKGVTPAPISEISCVADVDAGGLSKSTGVRTSCGGDSGDSASSSGSSLRFVRVAFCSRAHYLLQTAFFGYRWKS